MKIELTDGLVYGMLALLTVVFVIYFPQGWLISDEYTYFNQSIAYQDGVQWLGYTDPITQEYIHFKNSQYTLGNASWVLGWSYFFGPRGTYLGSLIATLCGILLLYTAIKKKGLFVPAICFAVLYPATMIYMHSLMSGVPSFLISCVFVYLLILRKETAGKWFVLTALAAFSIWFRESNILLLGGICLIHFIKDRKWFLSYALGGILGVLPRLISSYYCYDNPFHYVQGAGFSLSNGINNLPLYFILAVVLMPLSWLAFILYRGAYRWPIAIASAAFFLLYLLYGYNAIGYSGYKTGTIVMSRFLLPILPIYVLVVATLLRKVKLSSLLVMTGFAVTAIVGVGYQYIIGQEQIRHHKVSKSVYDAIEGKLVMLDLSGTTNVIRYVNPMRGRVKLQADISNVVSREYMSKVFALSPKVVLVQTLSVGNIQKLEKTASISKYANSIDQLYNVSYSDTISVNGGLKVVLTEIEMKSRGD